MIILGWSESYYADMKNEAERELRKRALPLLETTIDVREAIACYSDFSGEAGELETLLERLQIFLEGYLESH